MSIKQYYTDRFRWIFNYRNKNVLYCVLKTLCITIGLPLYLVAIVVEFALTFVNALLSWIPLLNVVVQVVFKVLIAIVNIPFYWCILPDLGAYNEWEKAQTVNAEQSCQEPAQSTEQSAEEVNQPPQDEQ